MPKISPKMSPRGPQEAPRGPQEGPKIGPIPCPRLNRGGPFSVSIFKSPSRPILGPLGAHLGPLWGPSWAPFGAILGPLGPVLGPLGPILGSSWAFLGPSWAYLGPFWAMLVYRVTIQIFLVISLVVFGCYLLTYGTRYHLSSTRPGGMREAMNKTPI